MALPAAVTAHLDSLTLPNATDLRVRLQRWMAQTGWNDQDVADNITRFDGKSYSRVSVNNWRNGYYDPQYPHTDRAIRAAIVSLMDKNPTVNERAISGKTYHTEAYKQLRRAFRNALDHGWSYCIDGAPGTQKTRLLLALGREIEIEDLNKNGQARRVLYVRCRPKMPRTDLLAEILIAGGIQPRHSYIGQSVRRLRHGFSQRRVVLVLDEAQDLDDAGLNTVRELLDEPPYFGLIFAGTHDLRARFHVLENERLRSRQRKFIELSGLTRDEVKEIWENEIGALSATALDKLLKYCTVQDHRKGRAEYLSARQLFFAIDGRQKRSAEDGDE